MANVIINDTNLTNIADAIRGKNGTTDTYLPSEMAAAITNLPSGGGGVEPLVLTGNCSYRCSGWFADYYIGKFGDTITTKDVSTPTYMFKDYKNASVPFEVNCKKGLLNSISYIFHNSKLEQLPKINNLRMSAMNHMCNGCSRLREIPEDYFDGWDFSYHATGKNVAHQNLFTGCQSLRSFPTSFLGNLCPNTPTSSSSYFNNGFNGCNALDELTNLPIPYTATWTQNAFVDTFWQCLRLKELTFEAGKVVKWKNQTIDLSVEVGFAWADGMAIAFLCGTNSGITEDKLINSAETYAALKNDKDAFVGGGAAYSRYNLSSAISTLFTLPDTSAYLASAGGTNTIKFTGEAGSGTDEGAIRDMPEELIAMAAAKGWTVSFV
jgi:hypothetical protein